MQINQKPTLHASWIDPDAVDIVRRLQNKGYHSYLVGGCVRDLLCYLHPKDYDIATDALPNEIRKLIFGSYVIGRRFRLVLVKRGAKQFEVATFRRAGRPEDFAEPQNEDTPPPVGDNFFGTPEEDALRRDFTINALFFDPVKNELIDYSGGMADIQAHMLRMIGDPSQRIQEDPIRSLRALRLSHKLKFRIEENLRSAVLRHADLVAQTVLPRRREEYLKFFRLPDPATAFLELYDLGLMAYCLPSLVSIFSDSEKQDIFLHYLQGLPDFADEPNHPLEIYLPLILGYRAAVQNDPVSAEEEENFLRNELGMFKGEIAEIQSILQLKNRLKDVELFKRRGHRRQRAFLSHPNLLLAFRVCQFERELSANDLMFWKDLIHSHLPAAKLF
ncbi:MAG: poly(A) polymerase [Bdellovibrio sp.]|nr:MAG: poly(A) polymerase [Bdellovibrio sp.]